MDVVAVVHLGQVVEAAGLHTHNGVDATSGRQTGLGACSKTLGDLADIRHVIIAMAADVDMHSISKMPMAIATTNAFTAVLHQSQDAVGADSCAYTRACNMHQKAVGTRCKGHMVAVRGSKSTSKKLLSD